MNTTTSSNSSSSSNFGQTLNLNEVIEDMFMVLTDKERDVVIRRYSLNNQPRETLERIGKSFKVTRERVRQIENAALGKLRRTVDNTKLRVIIRRAKEILQANDGLMLEKQLINEILQTTTKSSLDGNIIKLALSIDEDVLKVKKSNEYKPAWRLDYVRERSIKDVCIAVVKYLDAQTDVIDADDLAKAVQKQLARKESLRFIKACLEIHKSLKKVDKNKWGLMTWRHINPKSIRDKAYIVLKGENRPLHFVEIANKITESEFDKKVVTVQAVHNELIRGENFVLVGRGLYALKEWGYVEGTVSDVIERILKKAAQPLEKSEIVKRVLEVRNVKVGTIALNLQKSENFERVGRAVYQLKD